MTTIRRRPAIAAFAILVAFAAALPFIGAGRAGAADSQIYVVHGIPGVPVDVYAGGNLVPPLAGFQPGTTAGPLTLPSGNLPLALYPAIPNPPAAAADRVDSPALTQTVTVPSGANAALVASLVGGSPNLDVVFPNDFSAVPEGQLRVTVRHAADAPAVRIVVDGQVKVASLDPGAQASLVVPAGTYDIQVQLTDGAPLPTLSPGSTSLPAGKNVIVTAIGSVKGESLQLATPQVVDIPTTPAPAPQPETPAAQAPASQAPAPVMASPRMTG